MVAPGLDPAVEDMGARAARYIRELGRIGGGTHPRATEERDWGTARAMAEPRRTRRQARLTTGDTGCRYAALYLTGNLNSPPTATGLKRLERAPIA